MKRYLIPLLIVLVPVSTVALWAWVPRTVPLEQCSDLYCRYADNEHLDMAFVQGFHVNDSVTVDVTMLQAADSIGWNTLEADFNIAILPPHIQKIIDEGHDFKSVRLTPKEHLGQPMDSTNALNNDVIGISRVYKNICIFHIQTLKQINDILENQFP